MYGKHHSKETKEKLSHMFAGKTVSDEVKAKISIAVSGKRNGMYGKKHSEETKRKMSVSRKGKKLTDDQREKLKGRIPWNKGIPRTQEVKNKLSLINKGRKHSEEVIKNMSFSHRGENHGKAILKESQVIDIIYNLSDGKTIKELSNKYSVSYNTISLIKYNCTWKHVLPEIREKIKKGK